MKKYFYYLITVHVALLIGWQLNSFASILKTKNNIIIIYKRNPIANSAQQNQFYTKNFVRYFDDNFIEIQKELKNKLRDDTLKINTADEFYPIMLFHNYVYFNYLFKRGDTIIFNFNKDDIPKVKIINRDATEWEENFPILMKKRFNQVLKSNGMIGSSQRNRPTAQTRFNNVYASFTNQNMVIDSLLGKRLISAQLGNYYKDEVKTELYRNINFKDTSPHLYKIISKDIIVDFANRGDLIKVPFFQNFLEWSYMWSDILAIERINLTQSRTLNYAMAYNKVSSHFTNSIVREYLLFYCVNKIKEESTKTNYDTYLAKFKSVNKNKAYLSILNSDEINNTILMDKDAIAIADINGKQADLNKAIKAAKGKVVYVDLWASWCAPCRAAMPASKKLKTSYANKPLTFIYLSLDVKKSDWIKAADEENIKGDRNSFLLLNPKNSMFTKKLNLSTIPRYLIYNKNGELVNANAPGPDSPKLIDLLNQYLSN